MGKKEDYLRISGMGIRKEDLTKPISSIKLDDTISFFLGKEEQKKEQTVNKLEKTTPNRITFDLTSSFRK